MKSRLFFTVVLLASVINADPIQVTIKNGPIVGETFVEPLTKVVLNRFLAIPYAKPPVGSLRFRKPQPPDSWTEPLKTVNFSNRCIQNEMEYSNLHALSEDCLYLNVWSPDVGGVDQNNTSLRPVMVWIHGGALVIGSAASSQFDSAILSAKTDAVIVTINYRLSTLGFLYSDEVKEISGNQGFWDQALALEWVQDNIRYFGGDPRQVTIFGESAGSWSVSAHILSPVSRNLFQNAYMASGSVRHGVFVSPKQYAARMMPGIRNTGCATTNDTSINRKVLQCLEKLDAEKFVQIWYYDYTGKFVFAIAVIDGQFMSAHPQQMLREGNHKQNFSLLISTVENEASFLYRRDSRFVANISLNEAKDILYQEVMEYTGDKSFQFDLANQLYFGSMNPNFDSPDLFRRTTSTAFGDLLLTCPTILFGKDLIRSNSIRVYQVYYTFKLGFKLACPQWAGTCHGDEVEYMFGLVSKPTLRKNFLNRQRDISNEILHFFSSFIRAGEPGEDHSEWQPYFMAPDSQQVIAPYYELSNNYKTHQSFGFNLKQVNCEHLWNQFYQSE